MLALVTTAPEQRCPGIHVVIRRGQFFVGIADLLHAVVPGCHGGNTRIGNQLAHTLGVEFTQFVDSLHFAAGDQLLALGRIGPGLAALLGAYVTLVRVVTGTHFKGVGGEDIHRLVTTKVPGFQRMAGAFVHRLYFANQLTDEIVGGIHAGIDIAVVIELHRQVLGVVLRVDQAVRGCGLRISVFQLAIARLHRHHRGTGVGRHIKFRHHLDMAICRVAQDFLVVSDAVETTAKVIRIGTGSQLGQQAAVFFQIETALAANLGQFRQAGNLQAPALIIGQVEVKPVELVGRHLIQQLDNHFFAVEVAAHVHKHAAVREARCVFHNRLGQAGTVQIHQGKQGLHAIKGTAGIRTHHLGTLFAYVQAVRPGGR